MSGFCKLDHNETMNKVLLTALLIIEIQRYSIHYIKDFTIAKSFPTILQCGTSKVESDREAEVFKN